MNTIDPDSLFLLASIFFPFVLGVVLVFLPYFVKKSTVDFWAILGFVVPLVCGVFLAFSFSPLEAHGYDFLVSIPLGLNAIGVNFSVGLNALSLPLYMLTIAVGFAVALYTLGSRVERRALFWGLLLMIFSGTLGAFASTDLFYSFLFHEIALLPTLLALAIFGGANRRAVTIELGLWLMAGSLLILVGMLLFYFWGGVGTFNVIAIHQHLSQISMQATLYPIIWGFLLVGLAIIVGLFPFYSWVPKLLTTAPTAVSMLHVGALKMFGLYYLVQFFVGWMPVGVVDFTVIGAIMSVASILFLGMTALRQGELKSLLSYANLSHVGVLVAAILAYNHESIIGLTLSMFGSGLAMALLFMSAGVIDRRVGCLEMIHLGGLRRITPHLATFLMIGFMAVAALPCFVTFVGEFGILLGVARALPWTFIAIMVGMVIAATYSIRAINRLIMGMPKPSSMRDLKPLETIAAYVLAVPLVVLAFIPSLITSPLNVFLPTLLPFSL